LYDKKNELIEYQAIGIDLTEKRKSEEDIRNANYKLAQLINSVSSILIGISTEKIITHFNPIAEQVFFLKSDKVINNNMTNLKIEWDWEKINLGLDACIIENHPVKLELLNYKDKDGNARILGLNFNPINNIITK